MSKFYFYLSKKIDGQFGGGEDVGGVHGVSVLSATVLNGTLTLCMLGKNFSRQHFEIFFLFFLENRI